MPTKKYIQMDVMALVSSNQYVEVVMHTHEGSVPVFMDKKNYEHLKRNNFFIDPESNDGTIATTETFIIE